MGHAIQILTFPAEVNRQAAYRAVDEVAVSLADPVETGYATCGIANPIRWIEWIDPFADFEEARDFLYSDRRRDYETWAVRFRGTGEPGKRTKALAERVEELRGQLDEIREASLPRNRKSSLISCPECSSKLSRVHLGSRSSCPLCRADLRSKTARDCIAAKEQAVAGAERKLRESRAKDSERAEIMWAVIVEVHC